MNESVDSRGSYHSQTAVNCDTTMETAMSKMECNATCAQLTCTEEELRDSARAQIAEIEKYRWCLGVQLGRDPLLDRTKQEICEEWIAKYAAEFRLWWDTSARVRREREPSSMLSCWFPG